MKTFFRVISAFLVAVSLLCSFGCNSMNELNATNALEQSTSANVDSEAAEESAKRAKELITVNLNGTLEESRRAAEEMGIVMPEPIANQKVETGTYPIQGFLLSAQPTNTEGNGMSCVYRLSDGRFFIYDGGYESIAPMLYKCMKDLSGGGKIRVAAWVITHDHGDHYGAVYRMAQDFYTKDISVEEFWMNPTTSAGYDLRDNYLKKYFKNESGSASTIRNLTYGENITLDKINIKVLSTPDKITGSKTVNSDSLVMMLNISGTKILMTGDADEPTWNFMVRQHNNNSEYSLKCDYLQMPHHAVHASGTAEGYAAANPSKIIIPATTTLIKKYTTASNAKPSYDVLVKFGINPGSLSATSPETNNSTYWFAGHYGLTNTKNIKCFFTAQ